MRSAAAIVLQYSLLDLINSRRFGMAEGATWMCPTSADMSRLPQRSTKWPPSLAVLPDWASVPGAVGFSGARRGDAGPAKRGLGSSVPSPPRPGRCLPSKAPPVPCACPETLCLLALALLSLPLLSIASLDSPGAEGSFRLTSNTSSGFSPCTDVRRLQPVAAAQVTIRSAVHMCCSNAPLHPISQLLCNARAAHLECCWQSILN